MNVLDSPLTVPFGDPNLLKVIHRELLMRCKLNQFATGYSVSTAADGTLTSIPLSNLVSGSAFISHGMLVLTYREGCPEKFRFWLDSFTLFSLLDCEACLPIPSDKCPSMRTGD